MDAYVRNTQTYVWAFLTAITIVSWWLSHSGGSAHTINATVTFGVLSIAFIKVRFVMWHFMDVKTAPAWLKKTCGGWLLGLAVIIFALYGFALRG